MLSAKILKTYSLIILGMLDSDLNAYSFLFDLQRYTE